MIREGRLKPVVITRLLKARDRSRARMICDGRGLYLRIGPGDACSWSFRWMLNGKADEIGLGPFPEVGLTEARAERDKHRSTVKSGKKDPRAERRLAEAKGTTFRRAAERFFAAHGASWNVADRKHWPSAFATYVYPVIGDLPVSAIDKALVIKTLEPTWKETPVEADRIRRLIAQVLDAAEDHDERPEGKNPARKSVIVGALGKQPHDVKHHEALPLAELPAFMASLRSEQGTVARLLEWAILTCARTSEARLASWTEIDLAKKLWTIPRKRMKRKKGNKPHQIPLCSRALEILSEIDGVREGSLIFHNGTKAMSEGAMLQFLRRRMDCEQVTVHGFRSTFDDWAIKNKFPPHLVDKALDHAIRDKTVKAYRRDDLVEERRELMRAWAKACEGGT